jgi:hypothetical protein
MLDSLKEKLEEICIKIADARGEHLNTLLDEYVIVENQIEEITNPKPPPFSKEEFESHYSVGRKYQSFHDEYGDAAALYSEYLDYHYRDYLEHNKKGLWYSI